MKVTKVGGSGHKIEESIHPQQNKNKGILHCVALESESENKKNILWHYHIIALIYCSIRTKVYQIV